MHEALTQYVRAYVDQQKARERMDETLARALPLLPRYSGSRHVVRVDGVLYAVSPSFSTVWPYRVESITVERLTEVVG